MKSVFLFLFLLPQLVFLQPIYYLSQSSASATEDGSLANPFKSLSTAFTILGAANCHLVLLGASLSISANTLFPAGSNYTLRPEVVTPDVYFPLYLQAGARLEINAANATLQGLEFIELVTTRTTSQYVIYVVTGNVTLQSCLTRNILYSTTYYFIRTSGNGLSTEVNILDCQFKNLQNVQFHLLRMKTLIKRTSFIDITQKNAPFIAISSYSTPGALVSFRHVRFENINIGLSALGFINTATSKLNIIFDGFIVKNLRVADIYGFISHASTILDLPTASTSFTLRNGLIKGYTEAIVNGVANQKGLFCSVQGPTLFTVSNVVMEDIYAELVGFINYVPLVSFLYTFQSLPVAVFEDMTIRNFTKASFMVLSLDTIILRNILIEDTLYAPQVLHDFLYVQYCHVIKAQNITLKNYAGQFLTTAHTMAHEFTKINFTNVSLPADVLTTKRSILFFSKTTKPASLGLNPARSTTSIFSDIYLNGVSATQAAGGIIENILSLIRGNVAFGEVIISDSNFVNLAMKLFESDTINTITVRNITMESDELFVPTDINKYNAFQFKSLGSLLIKNSTFRNNKNLRLISLRNVNGDYAEPNINLEELQVINNNDVDYGIEDYYGIISLFSPQQPLRISFQNNLVQYGKTVYSFFDLSECYQVSLDISNNRIEHNTAVYTSSFFCSVYSREKMSSMVLKNNTFTNNTAEKGGVLFFSTANFNIQAQNNTFVSNKATKSGGAGFVEKSIIIYSETDGKYIENSAASDGGSWFLSTKSSNLSTSTLNFKTTTFTKSIAVNKGGAISLARGDLLIEGCTFERNEASREGGDLFLAMINSAKISSSKFSGSISENGALLHGEDLIGGTVSLNNVQVSNFQRTSSNAVLITAKLGFISLKDSSFQNINLPLFSFEGTPASLENLNINNIKCDTSLEFCILGGSALDLTISNSKIKNIVSNKGMIRIDSVGEGLIYKTEISDITLPSNFKFINQLYAINAKSALKLTIQQSSLSKIPFSFLRMERSLLIMHDNTFSHGQPKSRRLVQIITEDFLNLQFIVLYSSHSKIFNSRFDGNSNLNEVNGGAIRISGTTGTHSLSGSIFKNNFAKKGGAISLEGRMLSFTAENCEFSGNQASENGGALIVANQTVLGVLKIAKGIFSENKAILGGALFIGNQATDIIDSNFTNNNASQGGAIASLADSNYRIGFQRSTFTGNTAKQGSALLSFGDSVFDYQINTIPAPLISSRPTKLRINAYQMSRTFLFLRDVLPNEILAHQSTKLVYQSDNLALQNPLKFSSGVHPSYLFEFVLLDTMNQPINQEGLEVTKKLEIDSTLNSFVSKIGLLGVPNWISQNGNLYIVNSLSILSTREEIGTQLVLSTSSKYLNRALGELQTIPSLKWAVVVSPCSVGEVYKPETSTCSLCQEGTYSLEDPDSIDSCVRCMNNAVCLGGNVFYPTAGYWRQDDTSELIIECPNPNACIGGSRNDGRDISLTGFCNDEYEGVACNNCHDGYAKFGNGPTCFRCQTSAAYYLMFLGFLAIELIIIVVAIKMNLPIKNPKPSQARIIKFQSTILKIIIEFIQVLNLISTFNFNWPTFMKKILTGFTKIIPDSPDALSTDCLVALLKGNNKHLYFIKLMLLGVEPFLCMVVSTLIWYVRFRRSGEPVNTKDFRSRVTISAIIIAYILQPGVVKILFQLFNCRNFGTHDQPKYLMYNDTEIECWTWNHLKWSLGIAIPFLTFVLVLPVGYLFYYIRKHVNKTVQSPFHHHVFLLCNYKDKFAYWEVGIFMKKLCLILISVFITSGYIQAYLCFVVFFITMQLRSHISPYQQPTLNMLEILNILPTALLIYSGLYFVRRESDNAGTYFLTIVDFAMVLLFFVYTFFIMRKIIKEKSKKLRNKLTMQHIPRLKSMFTRGTPSSSTSNSGIVILQNNRSLFPSPSESMQKESIGILSFKQLIQKYYLSNDNYLSPVNASKSKFFTPPELSAISGMSSSTAKRRSSLDDITINRAPQLKKCRSLNSDTDFLHNSPTVFNTPMQSPRDLLSDTWRQETESPIKRRLLSNSSNPSDVSRYIISPKTKKTIQDQK